MNKALLLAATISLFLSSCVKEGSTTSLTKTIASNATTVDLSKCKMRRIYQVREGATVSGLFSYNKAGNPFSLIYNVGGTGYSNHYFYYDAANRLVTYNLTWGDYVVESHEYTYDAEGKRIVQDYYVRKNCCGAQEYESVSAIEYDAQGRVIKETIVNTYNVDGIQPTRRPTYTYDSRGNLAVKGWKSSSYDNKINPLRQSAVFQFIPRNYSMNNPAVQPKYNSLGLPLSIKPYNDDFFNDGSASKVVYDCQ